MLATGSSGKFRRHLQICVPRRREEEGKGWGEKQEGRIEIKPLQDGQWEQALSTCSTGSPRGSVGGRGLEARPHWQRAHQVTARAWPCKGRQGPCAEHIPHGKAHHCCRPDVSPLTAHPSDQQNLPPCGAQLLNRAKAVTKSKALEKHWARSGEQSKTAS